MHDTDRRIVGFTVLGHAMFHTYELSVPIFVGHWMQEFGLSAAVVGTAVAMGYGLVGVGAPVSGVLSDRFGSHDLIVLSIVGMGVGFALLSVARGIVSLALAILLWGAFASIYHPAGLSLISRGATERGTVFAYHGAGGNVGTAVGPLCTVLLLSVTGWRTTAVLLFVPAAVAAVVGFRINLPSVKRTEADGGTTISDAFRSALWDSRRLFTLSFSVAFVAVLLYGTYYRGLLTFLPDILDQSRWVTRVQLVGQTVDPAEYVYSAMLTVGIAGQYAGGKVTDRVPSLTAFFGALVGLTVLAIAFVVAWGTGPIPLVIVTLALGFFVYGTAPIYQVIIAEQADDDVHGLSYGFTYLAMFGIGALGASVAGTVLTFATTPILFSVLAAIALAGCVCVLVLGTL
ncbi:MFS transporter [Halopiger thermotolerans]